MSSLKQKLAFSYGLLIIVIFAVSAWSIYHLLTLGRAIDVILINNYKSILAAENMKDSLERQDSSALFFIASQEAKALGQFEESAQRFSAEYDIAANNITENGEAEIIADIDARYRTYKQRLESLLRGPEKKLSSEHSTYYFARLEPDFLALRARLDDLLHLNQQAMVRASDRAVSVSKTAEISTAVMAGLALALALIFAWRFTRFVAGPIAALTEKAKRIGEGDLDQYIDITSSQWKEPMSQVIDARPTPESLLARPEQERRARLRIYIGAAPGVGKTYQILEDAHQLKKQGLDIVIGFIEPHGRAETEALIGDLECVPLRCIEYRGVTLAEMDVDAVIARKPQIAIVDELAHTNAPGSKNKKRFEDVLEILDAGIAVITAVNVQHIESLNDAIARITGVRVREAIPDYFLRRADEVVNVDVSVDTLRTRLRQGKIYNVEKIEQALTNFFRKGNLSALRELALRQVAEDQAAKSHDYREREGLEQAAIPEKVMVCMASRGSAKKLLRTGSRIAGRLASDWYAVYVETPREGPARMNPADHAALMENIKLAEELGANVVKLNARRVADALIEFARREGITHVVFGQSARSRWDILIHGSVINRFLSEVRGATVQVVPLQDE